MIKKTVRSFALGALALSLGACDAITAPGSVVRGSGMVVEQDRAAWGATIVQLHAPGELRIVQGATEEFWIQAEDNLIGHLRTRVDGRTLRIEVEHGIRLDPRRPIRYNLVVRDLERVVLTGSGRADVFDLVVPDVEVVVGGSGGVLLHGIRADALYVTLGGSGPVEAWGSVLEQRLTLTGSGRFHGGDLASRFADIEIGGSGSATVRVRDRLDARVTGSGSVLYYGNPQVWRSGSGSGDVRRLGS